MSDIIECSSDIMDKVKSFGAESVDIMVRNSRVTSVNTRMTKIEKIEQADSMSIDMRVFIGRKNAVVSANNINAFRNDFLIEKAIFAAKNAPENLLTIRPDASDLYRKTKEIDIFDCREINHTDLIDLAEKCESIALETDGITNSEGAEASYAYTEFIVMRDDGFLNTYKKTSSQFSVITLAEKNGCLERDYAFSKAVYFCDLRDASDVAKEAAAKTVRKLGARKIKSCKAPIIFYKDVACQLLQSILEAVNGAAVARGMSFLKDKLSQKVFGDKITIVDISDISRGIRSRPFDGDGLECRNNVIMKEGVLNSFLLNTKYANILHMQSTGNASEWETIVPNNVYLEAGVDSFDNLLKNIKNGLLVTEVLGNGLNLITGNYSQGVAGFWVENGEILYPVNEVTVAGNIIDMFSHCVLASDLKLEFGIDSPTIFVEEMVIGGM